MPRRRVGGTKEHRKCLRLARRVARGIVPAIEEALVATEVRDGEKGVKLHTQRVRRLCVTVERLLSAGIL